MASGTSGNRVNSVGLHRLNATVTVLVLGLVATNILMTQEEAGQIPEPPEPLATHSRGLLARRHDDASPLQTVTYEAIDGPTEREGDPSALALQSVTDEMLGVQWPSTVPPLAEIPDL